MNNRITYTDNPDNTREVMEFVGDTPPCPTCNNTGEYEGEYGPKGCPPCCSRLVPFINNNGKRDYVDWGETVLRQEDGLHLVRIIAANLWMKL